MSPAGSSKRRSCTRGLGALVLISMALAAPARANAPSTSSFPPPTVISAGGGSVADPQVAAGRHGDAVAVWTHVVGEARVVEAASGSARSAWSPPTALSARDGSATTPQIAVDDHGNAVAVWARSTTAGQVIETASRTANGPWSPPTTLSALGGWAPQVALGAKGEAVAVWLGGSAFGYAAEAASRPAGGVWSLPTTLPAASRFVISVQVGLGDNGEAIAVWEHSVLHNALAEASSRPADGVWSGPTRLAGSSFDLPQIRLAVGDNGDAVAVWGASIPGTRTVHAASRLPGGAWSAATALTTTDSSFAQQAAVGDKGDAVAIWQRRTAAADLLETAWRPAGSDWSPATAISSRDGASPTPQVAVAHKDDAVAMWLRETGGGRVVMAAARHKDGTWSSPATVSPVAAVDSLRIAAAKAAVIALWRRDTGSGTMLEATIGEPW